MVSTSAVGSARKCGLRGRGRPGASPPAASRALRGSRVDVPHRNLGLPVIPRHIVCAPRGAGPGSCNNGLPRSRGRSPRTSRPPGKNRVICMNKSRYAPTSGPDQKGPQFADPARRWLFSCAFSTASTSCSPGRGRPSGSSPRGTRGWPSRGRENLCEHAFPPGWTVVWRSGEVVGGEPWAHPA